MAGMWEFTTGNVFGVVAFTSYGAFWISFATLFIPFFGIADAYTAADPTEVEFLNAIGHYLLGIGLLL
jgi:succinate-acetate transporter protein